MVQLMFIMRDGGLITEDNESRRLLQNKQSEVTLSLPPPEFQPEQPARGGWGRGGRVVLGPVSRSPNSRAESTGAPCVPPAPVHLSTGTAKSRGGRRVLTWSASPQGAS